jgi:predicted transcriptional regulator
MPDWFKNTRLELGELESRIMAIIWDGARLSVREVAMLLQPPLAYTTVMTTLDRLFKKGLLERSESERAFLYWARFTAEEWNAACAKRMLTAVLENNQPSRELLISTLVETLGQHDPQMLDELEAKIFETRKARSANKGQKS